MMNLAVESALLAQLSPTPRPREWAKSVQRLSNHYVASPDAISPWKEAWAREALLSYFHPLNQARAERVASKGAELGFFDGLEHLIDLGCGSGAASLGFLTALRKISESEGGQASQTNVRSLELVDHSGEIVKIAKHLAEDSKLAPPLLTPSQQSFEAFKPRPGSLTTIEGRASILPGTLLILSYVLTESHSAAALERLIARLPGLEALAILEPSTSEDARRLQALRPVLMRLGFHLWAPCTHAAECPLLKDSDRDWCHDRLVPELPTWWRELEAELPMKNKTVTVSYLLARRKPRPTHAEEVRVIGDRLDEKTKVRQMICRHEHREFISWFPSRLKKDCHLSRGDLFESRHSMWKDQRGAERGHEYRLDLEALNDITSTLRSTPRSTESPHQNDESTD